MHELQEWEKGVRPQDSMIYFSEEVNEVRSYMLAHEHFLSSINDILQDTQNNGKSSIEDIYNNMIAFCAERASVQMQWVYSLSK